MQQISRRKVLASAAAIGATSVFLPLVIPRTARAAAYKVIRADTRIIDVGGRAAKVLGLVQPDGTHGLVTSAGDRFQVRMENALDAPTLIHWHGLTPPFGQDGVPDLPQPLLQPRQSYDYSFLIATPGTHWMHAHTLQEQQLLAAPLIVTDAAEADVDEHPVVVLFHDFSFKTPQELLAGLTGAASAATSHSMSGHSMPGMNMSATGMADDGQGMSMPMDVNDIEYDAYLANDRTLDDPQAFPVERNGNVRLRLINGATATAFWIDTGLVEGEAIAVDGNPVVPVRGRRFPLAMGQRIDIRLRIPDEAGAWPVLALREGSVERTGFVLATKGGAVKRVAPAGEQAAPALDLAFEVGLAAVKPLAEMPAALQQPVVLGGSMQGYSWTLNGKTWGDHRPISVRNGQRIELTMRNASMMGHPMHLHGHHFQVVAIDGQRFAGAVRDTVWVPPMREVTVAFDAANPGTWAFHCHHLYHMATGMMTVVDYAA
ncbi:MAG: multicopper oxidase family protein [Mesorhizobium sp.]|uniref:multicopper oxidase family protein n=1 Tax=unclassified Mesorhizobium TaxID=325217 RepID=UPI000FCC1FF0|nr:MULTISPECIES: multicopper oxidase family protein [unclassified Mesorhizobium]RUV74805.1 multicopper oxidase family protein [Mesorhizobium sp. M5C.F.Cr.IN.023.01.1.1]RWF88687.1 MAG: multicopper oxidase family protein [Mesorhizobium sp.]RWF92921.1 MAG: multicopper oxidase family protein [Mesorhizobium sp.]RWI41244.1 MAG: multicopper oxidase family protein [Mesorhizobium sp.]RWI49764.1 MAG: multicopper oxidase family protein [Mesorhizobium sp.]